MKTKAPKQTKKQPATSAAVLNDAVAVADLGITFPVRIAKAKLSALLELVASGQEVVITSDGKPKARLVGIRQRERGKVFRGMGDYLMSQPIHGGPTADEIIREDRDSRGW
jgi:prevent-host-death family protein